MNANREDILRHINYLNSELNALYHQASVKIGLSDSACQVLYFLYADGGQCRLQDITLETGLSKQTIHSAICKLQEQGMLSLKHDAGRRKLVCLTPQGQDYTAETVARIFEAEKAAYRDWKEAEIEEHLRLLQKYNDHFKKQIELL